MVGTKRTSDITTSIRTILELCETSKAATVIHGVTIEVKKGNITQETVRGIVNTTNSTIDLTAGVSGAILKAAGQTVVDECNALGMQPSDGVVMTAPGNLPTKNIIHMVGQTKEKDITSSMLKVLKMCEDKKIQSVSFPALGTGSAGNLGAAQVGEAMMAAVYDLLLTIRTPSVKTIHIVVFQTKMMKDFEDILTSKLSKPTTQPQPSPTKSALCLAGACAEVEFPGMEAEVYGLSPASLAQVKKLLDDLISEECISQDLPSSHLSFLLEPQKKAIVALSRKEQVRIQVASPDKLTVSGKKDDVLYSILQIKDYLQEARDRKSRESEEKRMRETVRWKTWEGQTWVELDQSLNYDLEMAFHDLAPVHSVETTSTWFKDHGITVLNWPANSPDLNPIEYLWDIVKRKMRYARPNNAEELKATIRFPPNWSPMDNKDLDMVTLDPTSAEYQSIEKDLVATSKNPHTNTKPTINIVQSKDQWQRYAVKKQALDKKYPKNKNELNLYHGTTKEICQKINTCGFNRSFCGRNATVYGDGTYFAKEMWYSCHDTYSSQDASGQKYMYRARVLVGKPCLGVKGMKEPNPLNPTDISQGLFDCAVDNLQNPFIYVVFCDAGAYPDYLIIFKTA
uniref:Poly [ADP-ribose] polymerase n=1 Tax=Esox lucius TaxID=8010 RepID=A0AAY5KJC8_ESOLU